LPSAADVVERAHTGDVDDSMNSLSLLDLKDWELEPHRPSKGTSVSDTKIAGHRRDNRLEAPRRERSG
jgi:hypothetical protein